MEENAWKKATKNRIDQFHVCALLQLHDHSHIKIQCKITAKDISRIMDKTTRKMIIKWTHAQRLLKFIFIRQSKSQPKYISLACLYCMLSIISIYKDNLPEVIVSTCFRIAKMRNWI